MKTFEDFFNEHKKIALAYSGGTDSVFLLYKAVKCGADVMPVFIKSDFQPDFEFEDAKKAAKELHTELTIVEIDILSNQNVRENGENRCYYCKTALFKELKKKAASNGYDIIIDGTNASDDPFDRAGMKALGELGILSPLRECGITKDDVRQLSKEAGLFTWNKPAYACLATRITTGDEITKEALKKVENAENLLFSLGFLNFRVRYFNNCARIQIPEEQMEDILKKRDLIIKGITGFKGVFLDLMPR